MLREVKLDFIIILYDMALTSDAVRSTILDGSLPIALAVLLTDLLLDVA